jgi:hypothetical protein
MLALFRADGRIVENPDARGEAPDHDLLPAAGLLALAARAPASEARRRARAALAWYRRRFRVARPWAMVGWHAQAWAALFRATGDAAFARFAFELCDWALESQHRKTGAFLSDVHPDGPGADTALIACGVADAWRAARAVGDRARAARYARSCREAAPFIRGLMLAAEDSFCLAEPRLAAGGLRGSPSRSGVRIDTVAHALAFFTKARRLLPA